VTETPPGAPQAAPPTAAPARAHLPRRAALGAALALLPFARPRAATVRDADAQEVTVRDTSRIVSLGGDVTEIVYALGLGPRVVAVDSTSLYPAATEALPKVGYLRQLGGEALLSLRPSVILASGDAGPPAVLRQLRDAGVPLLHTAHSRAPEDVAAKIALIAEALEQNDAGQALHARFTQGMARARALVAGLGTRPRCLFILSNSGGAPMAAGRGTAADAVLALAGGVNVFAESQGYKPVTPEAAAAAAPEVVVMMSHTLEAMGGPQAAAAQPVLAMTPAGRQGRLVAVDGNWHLGFGPRLPEAVEDLARRMRA
jgi:iron complex transport system substrate-binding protein